MKDMLGVEVKEGDIILACAASPRGLAKLGRVYGFNKNGYPLVEYVGEKYNLKARKYEDTWRRGEAGSHVLVIESHDGLGMPQALTDRVLMEYPSASQLG